MLAIIPTSLSCCASAVRTKILWASHCSLNPLLILKRSTIDLQQTTPLLNEALKAVRDIVANGGRVLFVGTKRQARDKIAESAKRCGQFYVNHRWLGGMMTNWQTITGSINRLREVQDILGSNEQRAGRTKKEILMLTRERDKLELSLGGIKDMGGQPDALFILDVTMEDIAVKEANKLGIPVFGVVDTNADRSKR